jgi:hypothetical protein
VSETAAAPATDVPQTSVRRRRRGVGPQLPFVLLTVAFVSLLGAGAAAAWGQFKPGKTGPAVSIVLSAIAFVLTLAAVWVHPRR